MKRIVIFVLTALLTASCSSMLLEPEPHESIPDEEGIPMTKSGAKKEAEYDPSAVRYYFQTNRRVLLMHHVEYRDSAYVQTLNEDEMRAFGVTNEQKEFGNRYVVELNQINKRQ